MDDQMNETFAAFQENYYKGLSQGSMSENEEEEIYCRVF